MSNSRQYLDLKVSWLEHVRRAVVGIFVADSKPWHAHLYRAWYSWRGDIRYSPPDLKSIGEPDSGIVTMLLAAAISGFEARGRGALDPVVNSGRTNTFGTSSESHVPLPGRRRISVIINTYNRRDFLTVTLHAVRRLRHPCFEVIVVDGPSMDGTAELLSENANWLRSAKCPEANLSISRNIGLDLACGDIVCFIDDDAVPEPSWLDEIEKAYDSPDIGMVGGFVRDHTGCGFQARVIVCDEFGESFHFENMASALRAIEASPNLFLAPMGANCTFLLKAIRDIGGFDETYAYYLEETDAARRIAKAGYRVVFTPAAEVHHKFAPSHLRNVAKAPRSLMPIARSKAYFCMKSARDSHEVSGIAGHIARWVSAQESRLRGYRRFGDMDESSFARLIDELHQGVSEGVFSAFASPARKLRSFGLRDTSAGLWLTGLQNAKKLRISFVLSDTEDEVCLLRIAEAMARIGYEITCLVPEKKSDRIDYERGVWVHRIAPGFFDREMRRIESVRGIQTVAQVSDGIIRPVNLDVRILGNQPCLGTFSLANCNESEMNAWVGKLSDLQAVLNTIGTSDS